MSFKLNAMLLLLVTALPFPASAGCIPFTDAAKYVGTSTCVTGKVVKVTRLDSGTTFLNFCEDYRTCPFQVVIFRGDLRHVGDVRQLQDRTIEVDGDIKQYDRQPEIILRDAAQLRGAAAKIPPLPKGFDVEKKGRFSAGTFKHPKSSTQKKSSSPRGAPIPTGDLETE